MFLYSKWKRMTMRLHVTKLTLMANHDMRISKHPSYMKVKHTLLCSCQLESQDLSFLQLTYIYSWKACRYTQLEFRNSICISKSWITTVKSTGQCTSTHTSSGRDLHMKSVLRCSFGPSSPERIKVMKSDL